LPAAQQCEAVFETREVRDKKNLKAKSFFCLELLASRTPLRIVALRAKFAMKLFSHSKHTASHCCVAGKIHSKHTASHCCAAGKVRDEFLVTQSTPLHIVAFETVCAWVILFSPGRTDFKLFVPGYFFFRRGFAPQNSDSRNSYLTKGNLGLGEPRDLTPAPL
jgi:hypothetical protein